MERPSVLGRPSTWWGAALAWWLLNGVASASSYRVMSAGTATPVSWEHALLTGLVSALLWVPVTVAALHLTWWRPIERRAPGPLAVHLAAAGGVILFRAAAVLVLNPLVRWYPAEVPALPRLLLTSFFNNFFIYLLIVGVAHAVYYAHQSRERAAQLARARLQALTAQLQPHFLFNALNAVSSLVADHPERAERVLARLSLLLRRSLDDAGMVAVSLREELDFVAAYLEVEQARFEERLAVGWDVDPAVLDARVPSLLLQPIVENAVKHGIAPRAEPGTVLVSARQRGDRLRLEVHDDGDGLAHQAAGTNGFSPPGPHRTGLGIANTRARLAAAYGDRQRLELLQAEGGGTIVIIELPLQRLDAESTAGGGRTARARSVVRQARTGSDSVLSSS